MDLMNILITVVIGFVVGFVARAIYPGSDKAGIIITAVLGIIGSLVGTYAGNLLGWYPQGGVMQFVASVVGALIVMFVYYFVRRQMNKAK